MLSFDSLIAKFLRPTKWLRAISGNRPGPQPIRAMRQYAPAVRALEPRFVLNASAELNALGQLVISGDAAADTVSVNQLANGDLHIEQAGNVIAITNHPGVNTDPLNVSAITSGQVLVDLGGGDDVLNVDLADGLDFTVTDSAGNDEVNLSFQNTAVSPSADSIDVAAETVTINNGSPSVNLAGDDVRITGNLQLGNIGSVTNVNLGTGDLTVLGFVTLQDDLSLFATDGTIDWSGATLTTDASNVNVSFRLTNPSNNPNSASLLLGKVDASGGESINDLFVNAASSVTLADTIQIDGRIAAQGVAGDLNINASVEGQSVQLNALGQLNADALIRVTGGPITLQSNSQLSVMSTLDTSAAGNSGQVDLIGPAISLSDASVITAGGDINVIGPTDINGTVLIDSGNLQSAPSAGQISFFGSIDGADAAGNQLAIDARASTDGSVLLLASVGDASSTPSATQLSRLEVNAGQISARDITVSDSGIRLAAADINLLGTTLQTTAASDIIIDGRLLLPAADTRIVSGGSVQFTSENRGQSGRSIEVTAASDILFSGPILDLQNVNVVAGGTLTIDADVQITGDLSTTAIATEVSASSIASGGDTVFQNDVFFESDIELNANSLRFDGVVSTDAGTTTTVTAPIADPATSTVITKTGTGKLLLANTNSFTAQSLVQAGTLTVTGAITDAAGQVTVASGATLEGDGVVAADVLIQSGGVLSPGIAISDQETNLIVGSLTLAPGSVLRQQLSGISAGIDHDQLVIDPSDANDDSVSIDGAILDLSINTAPPPATEFVLINNDGIDPIVGRLSVNFDSDGNPISTARVLNEGDLVLTSLGGESTFVTYFGGDGNDVTLVTAGNVQVGSGDVTIVSRLGINIEVRTGADFQAAQLAAPTVRTISGLNANDLIIAGTSNNETLFIDINQFVDNSSGAINFSGDIFFNGNNGDDRIVLFDSDLTSVDDPDAIQYVFAAGDQGVIQIDSPGNATNFQVLFSGLEAIDQTIQTSDLAIQLSGNDDVVEVNVDPNATLRSRFAISSANTSSQLSVNNPTNVLLLESGAGNDVITINGFGTSNGGQTAPLTIDGQQGLDTLSINTMVSLGNGGVTGNLNLLAETLTISADIDTTGGPADGNINLTGGSSIVIDSSATVDVGSATIAVDGNGGSINTSAGNLISDSSGLAIELMNATNITLGNVTTASGTLQLGADANVTGEVTQDTLTRLVVDRLSASTSGRIDLSNATNEIRLVEDVQVSGEIEIRDSAGDLTLSRIDSGGSDVTVLTEGSLLLSNDAVTAIGATTILSANDGILDIDSDDAAPNIRSANVDLSAGSQGIGVISSRPDSSVDVVATTQLSARTGLFNGDIYLANRGGVIPIGVIDAGNGAILIEAGSIDDATIDNASDLIGDQVELIANTGIGDAATLELQSVNELTASNIDGNVDLVWVADASTTIRSLENQDGDIQVIQSGGQRLDIQRIESTNGSVRIVNDQSIGVQSDVQDTPPAVFAGQDGTIQLTATGNNADIFVRSQIQSTDGDIAFAADRSIVLSATGDVLSNSGNISLTADNRTGNFGGVVAMSDGALVDAGTGQIQITADGNIDLGSLVTSNASEDAVIVVSDSGSIRDRGDQDIDIVANAGVVTLQSNRGTGDGNAIETAIAILDSDVVTSGALEIAELDEIELRNVITRDGRIEVTAVGTITAVNVQSENASNSDDALATGGVDSRDISLSTTADTSDVVVDQIIASGGADVFLIARDDVLDVDSVDERRIVADDLFVQSENATADQANAIRLSTSINDLEISVVGNNRGDVEIREADSVNLAASDRGDDTERIQTANGEIRISAERSIVIRDTNNLANETVSLPVDPEIVASGDNGRIAFQSNDAVDIGDAVQILASQSTIEAVVIQSDAIRLGEDIEINTGSGIGVARIFSPRADVGLIDTAFFESTSVSVNILEQAAINDAEGQLTLDIGNEGERGLTINIDWGAETDRFQQIDNLSGDAPPLVVTHLYLEQDILDSRLNGRESATAPLNVMFSVRHHESILVLGNTVAQGEGDVESVEGQVVSSTDNPLTAESAQVQVLENGTASFIIPSLSIPVAFFPVRDVIPETEEPQVFVRTETTTTATATTLEQTETSVSGTVSRQEYFQIRTLSPDPDGEDLAPPERLPDDILDGDKLRRLFQNMPDGSYEIEYVLGDGNERSILQVDLRDGKPIITDDNLDGGPLRLRLIEGDDAENDYFDSGESSEDSEDTTPADAANQGGNVLQQNIPQQNVSLDEKTANEDSDADVLAAGAFATATINRRWCRGRYSAVKRFLSRADRNPAA